MSIRPRCLRPTVLLGLALGFAGWAPPASAQRSATPYPTTPGRQAQPARSPGDRTFNPSTAAADTAGRAGGPPTATLGRDAHPAPAYVGGGERSTHTTVVTPAYGAYVGNPVGGALSGAADLTAAQGQYWKDIQSAKMGREQAAQMSMDTRLKELQFQAEYEKYRPTAQKMMRAEKDFDLEWARKYAQNSEIWSGRALNVLLDSVLQPDRARQGPSLPLEDEILRGLNLTDQTSRSNGGMMKQDAKLVWPEALDSEAYDQTRDRFSKNWALARQQATSAGQVERATLRNLESDLKALSDQLDGAVRDLSPGKYITSRRYLNQLKDGVKALQETRSGKALNPTLVGQARNVAEMCAYMAKKGLRFAPAVAHGDEPKYSACYLSLRSYERSVAGGY